MMIAEGPGMLPAVRDTLVNRQKFGGFMGELVPKDLDSF
jgi:hypothetical protein